MAAARRTRIDDTRDGQGPPGHGPRVDPSAGGAPAGLLRLQRLAGNRAVAGLATTVQRADDYQPGDAAPGITEQKSSVSVMTWFKEAKKHLFTSDEDKKKAEAGEHWAEDSKEAALHAQLVLDATERALRVLARQQGGAGPSKAREMADSVKDAAEKVKKGDEAFAKGVEWYEKVELARKLVKAAEAADKADPRTDPRGAAKAFDELFGTLGEVMGELPKGPWSAYGDLLKEFGKEGGFFANFAELRLRKEGEIDPEKQAAERAATTPAAVAATESSIADVDDLVTAVGRFLDGRATGGGWFRTDVSIALGELQEARAADKHPEGMWAKFRHVDMAYPHQDVAGAARKLVKLLDGTAHASDRELAAILSFLRALANDEETRARKAEED
jgi:hypothetical protein